MVIDTHALTWWLEESPKLSRRAGGIISSAREAPRPLLVSAVSFWEMRLKECRGHFLPKTPVSEWPAFLAKVPWIEIVDTTASIWIAAAALDWNHRDPADRLIAATAIAHGVPVLTKDRLFHRKGCPVEAVW